MLRLLRILLIEDSEEDAELLLAEIPSRGLRAAAHPGGNAGSDGGGADWRRMGHRDFRLHAAAVQRVLARCTLSREHDPDLPFIISSGNIGEDIAVEAMRAGAHDYVMKSNLSRLIPAIERELRESVVRRKGRQAQRELQEERCAAACAGLERSRRGPAVAARMARALRIPLRELRQHVAARAFPAPAPRRRRHFFQPDPGRRRRGNSRS